MSGTCSSYFKVCGYQSPVACHLERSQHSKFTTGVFHVKELKLLASVIPALLCRDVVSKAAVIEFVSAQAQSSVVVGDPVVYIEPTLSNTLRIAYDHGDVHPKRQSATEDFSRCSIEAKELLRAQSPRANVPTRGGTDIGVPRPRGM